MTNPEEVNANTAEAPEVEGDEALDEASGGRPVFMERPDWRSGGYTTYQDGERI
jgi:hypothetical protein